MTIHYTPGNIFESPAQVLVNPVNVLEHTMGAGLAKAFKLRYSAEYFNRYVQQCISGRLTLGRPTIYQDTYDGKWILNFPTKYSYKQLSQLQWIKDGLEYIRANYKQGKISSIAFPALGCGLGGLDLCDVNELFHSILGECESLDVYLIFEDPRLPHHIGWKMQTHMVFMLQQRHNLGIQLYTHPQYRYGFYMLPTVLDRAYVVRPTIEVDKAVFQVGDTYYFEIDTGHQFGKHATIELIDIAINH